MGTINNNTYILPKHPTLGKLSTVQSYRVQDQRCVPYGFYYLMGKTPGGLRRCGCHPLWGLVRLGVTIARAPRHHLPHTHCLSATFLILVHFFSVFYYYVFESRFLFFILHRVSESGVGLEIRNHRAPSLSQSLYTWTSWDLISCLFVLIVCT